MKLTRSVKPGVCLSELPTSSCLRMGACGWGCDRGAVAGGGSRKSSPWHEGSGLQPWGGTPPLEGARTMSPAHKVLSVNPPFESWLEGCEEGPRGALAHVLVRADPHGTRGAAGCSGTLPLEHSSPQQSLPDPEPLPGSFSVHKARQWSREWCNF